MGYLRDVRNSRPQLDPVAGSMNKISPSDCRVEWRQEEKSGRRRFLRGSSSQPKGEH